MGCDIRALTMGEPATEELNAGGLAISGPLPFVRTSLTLAGTGKANPSSLIAAITLAAEMARHRKPVA